MGNRCFHRRGWGRRFCFGWVGSFPSLEGRWSASLRSADGRVARLHTYPSSPYVFLLSEEEIRGDKEGEDYGDYAVHGEEGGVEFGEIVGLDEGMFVEQEERDGDDAG